MADVFDRVEDRQHLGKELLIHRGFGPFGPVANVFRIGAAGDGGADVRMSHAILNGQLQLAVQYCVAHPDISTTIAGSANPENVRNWAKWAETPMNKQLLTEVLAILDPIKDIGHLEGLPDNN